MISFLPLEPDLCPAFIIEMGERGEMWCGAQMLKRKNSEVCCKVSWFLRIKRPKSPSDSLVQRKEDDLFPRSNIPLMSDSTFMYSTLLAAAACQAVGIQW